MDLSQIKQLIDAMASSDLAEMSFSHQGWVLRLVRHKSAAHRGDDVLPLADRAPLAPTPAHPPPSPPAQSVPAAPKRRELLAPLFGVVHLQPAPGEPVFVQPGQTVLAGQTLCVIEAMKVFNAVLAESDGTVDAVLVESGAEVEAGQPLIRFA
ncbi:MULTISPECIES: acetyl-CoA carboxylase biotin carboxyl carrier protein [Ralstonia solanacearum species complex]|uniref:acetyl-CoA carboxylase biotin carboxyl carrier protein n=1 Tax=Ralstonia solanacearum species complex TaxID=3116862 RepID=UPI000E56B57A|nr:acetyl-CoA carboxylase biotin carboxyl carrier protein subunit [Ralstonia solanacearum]BEU74243.1 acetyl-CoA carboxylase biotin carboxyl carrier protein [Ralstonia pseudosolanacearum]AXV79128.1 acetyl-CoA carboxylase biotin carboxyl carrier protein subunit [Ralstonia solanacearum]AXV93149.1 acetyl-CoA carboxylase biotin carboxyl carrier protein subunit [Ralstonia solanacearum]AXW21201.1 acetyl-CoA carboxylase biotin carboxyl carrier protein subunit [Ralstonia solanacearum]AXW78047.1 acetyl-